MTETVTELRDDEVRLAGGPRLALRVGDGPLRPFLLVHGLGSDGRSWTAVAARLLAAGHAVVAVDLRGHGRSEAPGRGYDADTCADDLATLVDQLGFTGARAPVVAGHGWGADVALSLAARRAGVAAVACADGGWIRPAARFPSFEECWSRLAPPAGAFPNGRPGAAGEHIRAAVHAQFLADQRAWYPLVRVPVLLCPAVAAAGLPDPERADQASRDGLAEALAGLPDARVSWYLDADHDLPLSHPGRLADDLAALAAAAEPDVDRTSVTNGP